MKVELRRVSTVTLETNRSFTLNRTDSLAISVTPSRIRSLSATLSIMSFFPMCRTAISDLTFSSFNVDWIEW